MTMVDIDSALLSFTAAVARIAQQQDGAQPSSAEEDAPKYFGSLVVTLLFVPFSIYFGIVFLIFALECYQFFVVWGMVSRTRAHNEGVPRLHQAQQAWNSRYRGLNSDDDAPTKEPRYTEQEMEERLLVRGYSVHPDDLNELDHCPICLCDFQKDDSVASIQDCHCSTLFHHSCLSQWLREQPSCPYCRLEVLVPSPGVHSDSILSISESLELASLQLEQYVCNALTVLGEFVSSYTY